MEYRTVAETNPNLGHDQRQGDWIVQRDLVPRRDLPPPSIPTRQPDMNLFFPTGRKNETVGIKRSASGRPEANLPTCEINSKYGRVFSRPVGAG